MKRVDTKNGNDLKYDPRDHRRHRRNSISSFGHQVVHLSHRGPPHAGGCQRGHGFHIAEDTSGQSRGSSAALCDIGDYYTGSDSATLSICGQGSHQEGLEPAQHSHAWVSALCDRSRKSGSFFEAVIVKPMQGSSKNRSKLCFRQREFGCQDVLTSTTNPLVEEHQGQNTLGVLGIGGRVLPPMEIVFRSL